MRANPGPLEYGDTAHQHGTGGTGTVQAHAQIR